MFLGTKCNMYRKKYTRVWHILGYMWHILQGYEISNSSTGYINTHTYEKLISRFYSEGSSPLRSHIGKVHGSAVVGGGESNFSFLSCISKKKIEGKHTDVLKARQQLKGPFSKWDIWAWNRDRCYDFKNIFAKNIGKNLAFFDSKAKLNYAKIWSQHWFLRKTPIFSPKIVENRRKLWS
jgi:hypothetical protein